MPPGEKRGRTHTSTVTVAVLPSGQPSSPSKHQHAQPFQLDPRDLETRLTRDTGPGGQHRNKTESCVVLTHLPTGLQAKAASKCQHQNRREALAVLTARVQEHTYALERCASAADRRRQVGTGQRGDKVRTYRTQDDVVVDNRTGRKAKLRDVLAGKLDFQD